MMRRLGLTYGSTTYDLGCCLDGKLTMLSSEVYKEDEHALAIEARFKFGTYLGWLH